MAPEGARVGFGLLIRAVSELAVDKGGRGADAEENRSPRPLL